MVVLHLLELEDGAVNHPQEILVPRELLPQSHGSLEGREERLHTVAVEELEYLLLLEKILHTHVRSKDTKEEIFILWLLLEGLLVERCHSLICKEGGQQSWVFFYFCPSSYRPAPGC